MVKLQSSQIFVSISRSQAGADKCEQDQRRMISVAAALMADSVNYHDLYYPRYLIFDCHQRPTM